MSEEAAPVAQAPETAPLEGAAGLPAVTPEMRAAFANPAPVAPPTPATEPEPPAEEATPAQPQAAAPAAPAQPATLDYSGFVKELGYDSADALKAHLEATKGYDPKHIEALTANQRDAHDFALREMATTNPAKARAYFDLQALQPDEMAKGDLAAQRTLLFEKYKLDNPDLAGRLAEIEFDDEFERKYALADSEDTADPAVERAKLLLSHALKQAAPAIKSAQEAAKIALVPKAEPADKRTPEQIKAADDAWLAGIQGVLAQPKIEQVFQTENGPVTVGYDTKDATLGAYLENPLQEVQKYLNAVAYPNGLDKPADMAALASAWARLTKPEAIAAAAAKVGKDSVGPVVPMEKLVHAAPAAPQAPANGGEDQAGALAAIRAVAQGRR